MSLREESIQKAIQELDYSPNLLVKSVAPANGTLRTTIRDRLADGKYSITDFPKIIANIFS